jgi:hypothetical protein
MLVFFFFSFDWESITTLVGLQMDPLLQRINERVRPVNEMVILLF